MLDIIIPIYNTPQEDLERCFNSIINQKYKNINVYLIDDGSNNRTATFLDSFVCKNANFKILHKKNGGVSSARNVGLSIAKSDYIAFIDADDTISANFLTEAMNIIKNKDFDMVCGMLCSDDNIEVDNHIFEITNSKELKIYNEKLISGNYTKESKYLKSIPTGRIYSKIFKTKILKKIKFDEEITYSEDTMFCIDVTKKNPKIGIVYKNWYKYHDNDYSILHRKVTYSQIEQQKKLFNRLYQRALDEDLIISNAYKIRMLSCVDSIYKKMIKLNVDFFEFNEFINSKEYVFIKNVELKKYISISLLKKIKYKFYVKSPYFVMRLLYLFLSLFCGEGEKNVR